ncbi:rab-interacting lysosomal protein isoform X2 [Rhinoderma darwinii]|uniref:rab-interacting lysosomal protein isoform X2 n=1 Tax=Rhinoderma darwinii TaxID=43563 RepID=UPI003F678F2E
MEAPERVWRRAPGSLSLEDVYSMAKSLGTELQKLTEQYGPESVSGVVPQVVRVLELLEGFAATGRERGPPEHELLIRAVQNMHMGRDERPAPDLEQKLLEAQRKEHDLQNQLSQLTEENQNLLVQLTETKSQGECAAREERDLMLKLKVVVDRQRDEMRSLTHEIQQKNRDSEALQEQLNRFMNMNEDLRRKVAVVHAQLKSSLQRKTDLENLLQERQKEIDSMLQRFHVAQVVTDKNMNTSECQSLEQDGNDKPPPSNPLCFTKEDVKHILQERNELKTNLFLVNEELQYYHRELLNDERIPSLLLCGMKSAIRKQKKKIKAKMLGIVESPTSSDEENTWTQTTGTDCVDAKPPDSKIKSLFGMWYGKQEAEPGPWEIINVKEISLIEKEDSSSDIV